MKTGIYWQDPKYALKPGRDFIFDPSLVLYLPLYRLDGASFMSKDAYGHLCTVTGALWRPNGRHFDGDDYIDCGAGASLDITDAITIEAWVNLTALLADQVEVLSKRSNIYRLNINNNEVPRSYIGLSTGLKQIDFDSALSPGVWAHLVATYDKDGGADNLNTYFNAVLGTPETETGTITTSANNLYIGQLGDGRFYFPGLTGEVRVYNRALTPLEIQRNYLATKWRYR